MTSLIKNQILKHLTKFFKDLAPEQLQLSAFKGSCELNNLQLEENVLMDLLSFPAWIRINKAVCDQLTIKIPWTKIKSVPIQMNLNEVNVEVEVCDEFRDTSQLGDEIAELISSAAAAPAGKYGFVDRVIDGITVTVNNVLITFKSKLMIATFNLSRVLLESRCPNWKQGELSLTRIKDVNKSQILLFKIVEWQTMRLEAKCLTDPLQAPLRLITNHAQCRLTIKKKLDDCSVLAARIFVIFEDILWVLTFAQFISAASFVEYIFTLIKRSPISKKTGIFDDQSTNSQTNTSSSNSSQNQSTMSSTSQVNVPPPLISSLNISAQQHSNDKHQQHAASILTGNMSSASLMEQKFLCYDLIETSLHLYIDKVDAHLYDDLEVTSNPKQSSQRDSGGALQTTLDQIQVDCYPYSRAIGDRKHWYRWFDPSPNSRKQWFSSHFAEFDLIKRLRLEERENNTNGIRTDYSDITNSDIKNSKTEEQQTIIPTASDDQLLSLAVLVKIKDYCMHCVATKHSVRAPGLNKFIQTDKDYHMPSDMPSLYLELNYFYYFDTINRMMVYDNVPDPLAFVHLSPTKLLFDSPTLLFLNSFQVNLSKALVLLNDLFPEETTAPKIHCRVEILMPQISLPAKASINKKQEDSPSTTTTNATPSKNASIKPTSTLLLKSGKVTMSNSIYDKNVLSKLMASIDILKESPSQPINLGSYQGNNSSSGDWNKVWNASLINKMSEFNLQNKLWAMQFEPVWMDFMNYDVDDLSINQRLEPIVEPVHAYAFVHLNLSNPIKEQRRSKTTSTFEDSYSSTGSGLKYQPTNGNNNNAINNKRDIISILVTVMDGPILANMDRVQFSFLQRLGMHVEKLFQQIREDASSVIQLDTTIEGSLEVNLTAYIKDIKARLILEKKIEKQSILDNSLDASVRAGSTKTTCIKKELGGDLLNCSILDQDNLSIQTSTGAVAGGAGSTLATSTTANLTMNASPRVTSNSFFNLKPTILNPFNDKLQDEKILGVVYDPSEAQDTIGDDLDLDECTEVADDASCLFLSDSNSNLNSKVPDIIPTTSTTNKNTAKNNISTLIETTSDKLTNAIAVSGESKTSDEARESSVGKSPMEASLLINLDDMEQSSALFAKVDLKGTPEPIVSKPRDLINSENPSKSSGNTNDWPTPMSMANQPETEVESISYLELSMSKLMVRRITETKRRQKF